MPNRTDTLSPLLRWGAFYLFVQAAGAMCWWLVLWLAPPARAYFRPHEAPDTSLLAFFLPDAVGFIGAGFWAGAMLLKSPERALVPLAIHVGAATYAALYCLATWLLTREASLAALFMAPALFVGPPLLRKLCLYLRA